MEQAGMLGDLGDMGEGDMGYYNPQETDHAGGLPINLDSLRDGPPGSKPFYPYSTLIRYAIKGSPNQRLLLEDIYYAIESRFPYFKSAPSGWKNSVRHNLSLNPCFEKVPRPLTDRGKGSYWVVNENVDPRTGVHRIRKKKSTKGSKNAARNDSEEPEVDYTPPESYEDQYMPDHGAEDHTQPPAFPFPPPFDPNFPMMPPGLRFPLPGVPILPEEGMEVDEHGNINWHNAWVKEIGHLQQVTADQEKAGADQEWYRMILFRVRTALCPPPMLGPDGAMLPVPPHMMPQQPAEQ
ncbi:hypothetical protein BDZ89DRAFT_1152846 [Hymenopellis radicata]|nr:hypothetical protein BDZ89DRAFT_1152846 [Hymenopellis radicata]